MARKLDETVIRTQVFRGLFSLCLLQGRSRSVRQVACEQTSEGALRAKSSLGVENIITSNWACFVYTKYSLC